MYINSRYKINSDRLGYGSYSEVFSGYDNQDKTKVAIKKISLNNKRIVVDKIIKEVEIMQNFDNINIVKYHNIVSTNDYYYIIMEYCNAGTLHDYIYDTKTVNNTQTVEYKAYFYLQQLKNALAYMREKGYIHRDIKPVNILLSNVNNKLTIKLADFGLARYYKENDNVLLKTICGTPLYMAPELFSKYEYNYKADLWSYGVVMYEILFKEHPLVSANLSQLFNDIKFKNIDFHENCAYTLLCYDLLKLLLVKDSNDRIEWNTFIEHEWFVYWDNNPACLIETQNCSKVNTDMISSVKTLNSSNLTKMIISKTRSKKILDYSDTPSSYPQRGILCSATKATFSIEKPNITSLSCDPQTHNSKSFGRYTSPNSSQECTTSFDCDNDLDEFIFLENKQQSFPINIKKHGNHNYVKNAISYITSPLNYYSTSFSKSFSK